MAIAEFSPFGKDLFGDVVKPPNQPPLAKRFVFPPFSVFDARGGEWQDRKRAWIEYGISSGEGREALEGTTGSTTVCATDWMKRGQDTGGSAFDPVLAELVMRWFCPNGGKMLDPFGGESTKGIVAAALGYKYTGIELRAEQVAANQRQAAKLGLGAQWIAADSATLDTVVPLHEKFDLIWTSPPYFDLEIYSANKNDGSAFSSYARFMVWYEDIFRQAVGHLRDNRFLAVKVGEVRDEQGCYRNFVGDNITCFMRLGLKYYNEAILLTPCGSLPIRVSAGFSSGRKLGKTHQNVLLFWKGDPKQIKNVLPDL